MIDRLRRPATWLCAALLTACTAIPLSTMWRMRDLTPATFFAKDPTQLRVAVRTDERTRRGDANPMIEGRVDGVGTMALCYAFSLLPVDARSAGEATLESAAGRRWYAFRLSPDGLAAFEHARRSLRNAKLDDASFNLAVTMSNVLDPPKDAKKFPVRIDIALDRADGYFTLIKKTDVPLEAEVRKPASPPKEQPRATCAGVTTS